MEQVVTIGVYGWDGPRFVEALQSAAVDELWDVRDRRGVRGADGAWANATRLRSLLDGAGIAYRHVRELAPPTELRTRLQEDDRRHGRRHRDRRELPGWFVDGYRSEVLAAVDVDQLVGSTDAARVALLCVEGTPSACHRALAAEALAVEAGADVLALEP